MQQTIFRQCGIKGVNSDLNEVYNWGLAIAYYFLKYSDLVDTIIIGYDNNKKSENIKNEIIKAFIESGIKVIVLGTCPITVMQFSLNILPAQAGIMINSYCDNSDCFNIQIYNGTEALISGQISIINSIYQQKLTCKSSTLGYIKNYDMTNKYIDWLAKQFVELKNCKYPLNITCGDEIISDILLAIIKKIGLKFLTINNHNNKNLSSITALNIKLDLRGKEFELIKYGDCEISNDKLIAIFAQEISHENPDNFVLYDNMGSDCLDCFFDYMEIKSLCVESGIYDMQSYMSKNDSLFGAEAKGCFYFKDKYFGFSDSIYTILRFYHLIYRDASILDKMINMFLTMRCTQQLEAHY